MTCPSRRQSGRNPRAVRASAGARSRSRHRGGAARAAADQARRRARPARGTGRTGSPPGRGAIRRGSTIRAPCVFAGNHGVAARGVSAYPAAVTAQMVQNFIAGGAAVNQLCRVVDADLRVYEMNLDTPTADIVDGPAMSEEECARAIAYGMMAVEPGIDALAIGEMGIANTTVAAALCLALFGGERRRGPGPAPASPAPRSKRSARSSRRRSRGTAGGAATRSNCCAGSAGSSSPRWPARCWRRAWGACRSCSTGFAAGAAAAVLYAVDPRALDHCVVGHVSAEPGHRRLLDRIGKRAAARSRHAARRGLRRDPGARAAEGRRRLPHRHGDLRRSRGQRPAG